MSDKDAFADRRRGQEEEYFHKREQELIAKMRRQRDEESSRRAIAEQTGIADEAIVHALVAAGYRTETIALLQIVPLMQVAWAEGQVADRERERIVEVARAREIAPGSPADQQLVAWLTTQPPDALFDSTLHAIKTMLQGRPAEERDAARRDLIAACDSVASASGGVLGLGKASHEERDVVAHIRHALED